MLATLLVVQQMNNDKLTLYVHTDLSDNEFADMLNQVASTIRKSDYLPGRTSSILDSNGERIGGFRVSRY